MKSIDPDGNLDVLIVRQASAPGVIWGSFYIGDRFVAYSAERAYVWNKNDISAIPPGTYSFTVSNTDGGKVQLGRVATSDLGVGGPYVRTGVNIERANVPSIESKGCIFPGTKVSAEAQTAKGLTGPGVIGAKDALNDLRANIAFAKAVEEDHLQSSTRDTLTISDPSGVSQGQSEGGPHPNGASEAEAPSAEPIDPAQITSMSGLN